MTIAVIALVDGINDMINMYYNGVCINRRASEIQGAALGKCLLAWTCIYKDWPMVRR